MFLYKLSLILAEGAIFGLVALGIYVAFRWVRFPDLTPDGSFALGASACVLVTNATGVFWLGLVTAIVAGGLSGVITGILNRWIGIPSVVSGLLVASALYSVNWLLLAGPNLPIEDTFIPFYFDSGVSRAAKQAILLLCIVLICLAVLGWFANTIQGLRIRALGENPLLARSIHYSETKATLIGLSIANGIVGLAGGLFVLRLYAADINMGIGITITGLTGMVLGMLLVGKSFRPLVLLISVVAGALIYKLLLFTSLEIGFPAQSFRIMSAAILATAFLSIKHVTKDILGGLRWT